MIELIYKIELLSDWHCGSGLSAGSDVDALCIKDENGLPFIPGKTLKGLLKEAAEIITEFSNDIKSDFLKICFGEQTDKNSTQSDTGKCYFSNGELTVSVKTALNSSDSDKKSVLFRKISSTEIDADGQAVDHSLRKIETTVPLVLFAKITGLPNEYLENIKMCLKWVKRLGTNRNRGLGRCKLSVFK